MLFLEALDFCDPEFFSSFAVGDGACMAAVVTECHSFSCLYELLCFSQINEWTGAADCEVQSVQICQHVGLLQMF